MPGTWTSGPVALLPPMVKSAKGATPGERLPRWHSGTLRRSQRFRVALFPVALLTLWHS